ncbi:MAG: HAMP domain-containing protein [Azoarcus sp.]|nr:HAMP domain-containing protein [Azoarcus sp.]
MKHLWPRSLFVRLMLIWLIGTLLILAASTTLFFAEGQRAWFEGFAKEIATVADILDQLAPEERQHALEQQQSALRLRLRALKRVQPFPGEHPLLPMLREIMPHRQPALYISEGKHYAPEHEPLIVSVNLANGGDTSLVVRLPGRPPSFSHSYSYWWLSAFLLLIVGIGTLTWIGVRIATRPLLNLSAAAHALGEAPERPPLKPTGPIEVVRAVDAFNQMQQRIIAYIHERTRTLAAISHDLQTPITRLRLRAEMIEDETLQSRIQSDLDTMQHLIREGLDYARSMEISAPPQPIELNGLLAALCGDATDMGWDVSITGQASAPFIGHPVALRRALWNLIENGIKFGQSVEIAISDLPDATQILIRDHGPGLPAEEMERVFEPFYRTESSRSRETGGTGLGLAITRNLLHIQHGTIRLGNHAEGGLIATVILPRGKQSH